VFSDKGGNPMTLPLCTERMLDMGKEPGHNSGDLFFILFLFLFFIFYFYFFAMHGEHARDGS
jgi:hypothetical protein